MGACMAIKSPFRHCHQHDGYQALGKGEAGRDMAAADARTGAKRDCCGDLARLGLMRVGDRLWQFQAAPITDAPSAIRGPCAGPRRSGRGSSGQWFMDIKVFRTYSWANWPHVWVRWRTHQRYLHERANAEFWAAR